MRRFPEIVLGFLVATAFWTGILLWQSQLAVSNRTQKSIPGQHHAVSTNAAVQLGQHAKGDHNWYDTFANHTPDWFVAFFTALLSFVTYRLVSTTGDLRASTDKLWEAGERQIELSRESSTAQSRDMQSSISVASAANELNRRNFEGVHRPKIRVKHFVLVSDIWQDESIRVDITCVNHGTTDAVLQNIGVRSLIVRNDRELPIDPEISATLPAIGARLQSGLNYKFPNVDTGTVITPEQNVAIQDGNSKLFCIGYISYFDAASRLRITGFCRVLRFPDDGAALAQKGNCRFLKFDDPDYEYED